MWPIVLMSMEKGEKEKNTILAIYHRELLSTKSDYLLNYIPKY